MHMNFLHDESGQGTLEYGLILGLIAMVVVGIMLVFGSDTNTSLQNSANSMPGGSTSNAASPNSP